MNDKPHKVTLNLPEGLNLAEKDIEALREKFKAHIVDVMEAKGEVDVPVLDDTTLVPSPNND